MPSGMPPVCLAVGCRHYANSYGEEYDQGEFTQWKGYGIIARCVQNAPKPEI